MLRIRCAVLSIVLAGTSASGQYKLNRDVRVRMQNVMYHFTDRIAVHIREVNGVLAPVAGNDLPRNYMAYQGNRLRFGKLTMNDTDMILIDMDPKDPFDFYLDYYQEQLSAGYTKITPSFGLRVFMRDFNKLKRAASTRK